MSEKKDTAVIRIVKKRHGHGGHHGGSWKVAYADFVTALMAFFLVMWILGMDQTLREEIQSYFNDPFSSSTSRTGISQLSSGGRSPLATGTIGMSAKNWRELALEAQKERFRRVERKLERQIAGRPDLARLRKHVEIGVDDAGLLIELIEARDSLFFESGSARLPEATRALLGLVASELGRLANPIVVEGHTDVVPYQSRAEYSNWELSTDRANAARRAMQALGLRPRQVVEVRGYADTRLRDPRNPRHFSNRRVSIHVKYSDSEQPPPEGIEPGEAGMSGSEPFPLRIRPERPGDGVTLMER
jgi:chemotaxis protein MotB